MHIYPYEEEYFAKPIFPWTLSPSLNELEAGSSTGSSSGILGEKKVPGSEYIIPINITSTVLYSRPSF